MAEDEGPQDVDAPEAPETPAPPADWRTGLPPELATEKSLADFRDVAGLAKAYADTKRMVGNAVRLPTEDMPADQRAKLDADFRKKWGVPEAADQYRIERPQLPEGANWSDDAERVMLQAFHQAGLNPRQAQALFDAYGRVIEGQSRALLERNQKGLAEGQAKLQREWGPNYKRNLAMVQRAIGHLGDETLADALDGTGLGNHPAIVQAFLALAERMAEDGLIPGDTDGVTDSAAATQRIDAILKDKDHPFHNPRHPRHQEAVEELHQLHRIKAGPSGTRPVLTVG